MNAERLNAIEALLTAKLFPNGGYAETRELIEAVRAQALTVQAQGRVVSALHKALFCGEASGGAVDLSVAGHIALLRAIGNEHDARWATERYALISAASKLYHVAQKPQPGANDGK